MAKESKVPEATKICTDDRVDEAIALINHDRKGEAKVIVDRCDCSEVINTIPTGIYKLDGTIGGGIPIGHVSLFWGSKGSAKTSSCLRVIGNANRMCARCYQLLEKCKCKEGATRFVTAYFAAEPIAFTEWAKRLGVEESNMLIVRPTTAEEALEVMLQLVQSGKVDLIVLDSIAALIPEAESESGMGDWQQGAQARILGKFARKIQSAITQSKRDFDRSTTILLINQVRTKIGVMYGCLHADTMIPLCDGRKFPIKAIVDNKIEGEVFSFDESMEEFEKVKITGWRFNGNVKEKEDFISIKSVGYSTKNGVIGVTCTKDHEILTDKGWVKAESIKRGDVLLTKFESKINYTLADFVIGVLCADSHIRAKKNNGCIILQDSKNPLYAKWKSEKMSALNFRSPSRDVFVSEYSREIGILKGILGKRDVSVFAEDMRIVSLAILYMDDGNYDFKGYHERGTISFKRFKNNMDKMSIISDMFSNFGYDNRVNLKDGSISFNKLAFNKFCSDICKFIPECMQYKLPHRFRGRYEDFILSNKIELKYEKSQVVSCSYGSRRKFKQKGRYDISVERNSNYLAGNCDNGIVVHNSPDVQPGGLSIGFAAALEIKFYAKNKAEIEKDEVLGDKPIAIEISFCVDKRRYGAAKYEGSYKMALRKLGEKMPGEILDEKPLRIDGVKLGLISKKDGLYCFGDIQMGKNLDDIDSFLVANKNVTDALRRAIVEMIKLL